MKKIEKNDGLLIVGTGEEIKPVYRSIVKACYRWQTDLTPLYLSFPHLVGNRFYGIKITEDNKFFVIANNALVANLID